MYKLSIITINLNNILGLERTIKSVFNQSYKGFEYIIIDGLSNDGSAELISSNSNQLAYWISETDTGIYQAMNKGIQKASGEYLLFLNSGDFLVGNDVLTEVFKTDFQEDIVVGNCNVSQKGKVIFKVIPPEDITLAAFYGRTLPHQAAFFKKELFVTFGLYNEQYRIHADLEFFIKAMIINNCSYLHLPITITDYNLEGLSSDTRNRSLSEEEYDTIIYKIIPPRVLKDYAFWELQNKEMEVLYWTKSKSMLYKPLTWIYFTASKIIKLKKT